MEDNQRDAQWLGEEDALLGPAIRAALGILLERGDWTWWHEPSHTLTALSRAVPRHMPAKWGGDSSVIDADQWLDPGRALRLGLAFSELYRERPPKIKIVRSVWGWPDSEQTMGSILHELSVLVGAGRVFPEWERDLRPRFPIVPRVEEGLALVTSPRLQPNGVLRDLQRYVEWSNDSRVADIAVSDSVDSLLYTKARLVILYGHNFDTALARVSRLRSDLSAQCAIHVESNENGVAEWLRLLFYSSTELGMDFADAIEHAESKSGLRTTVLASTQSYFLSRDSFYLAPIVKGRDSGDYEYQGILDRSIAYRIADIDPIEKLSEIINAPPPPTERVLDATTLQHGIEIKQWPKVGLVDIDINIRVKTPLRNGYNRPSFPDERVEWRGESKTLQVHMFELGRQPVSQSMSLSRTGDSTIASFRREAGHTAVDLRFLVSDGAQILQTARLQTASGQPVNFFIENIVTPVHREKKNFGVALLVNESLGNRPSVTFITGDGEAIFSPLSDHQIELARGSLLQALEQAVANPKAPLESLMMKLANRGSLLQKELQSVVPNWPGSQGRVQLVTQSDAFFPIEYLYDGQLPESPRASLCAQRAGCLRKGRAIENCSIREAGEQLCPMGFLGISGVIERHSWKPGKGAALWELVEGDRPKRHRIGDLSTVAFAASNRADKFADADVLPHPVVRIANIETSLDVKNIPNWKDWKLRLQQDSPSLLLLLVHLDGEVVYVGDDCGLNLGSIGTQHVGGASVVIAIGCTSGLADIPGGSLPAIFQRNGARVVVAAMTNVLGRHANRIGNELAVRLKKAAIARESTTVGEIISAIRRELLADGLALGLAVVAFGDADIVLGKDTKGIGYVSY
ncbi:hypothetical protein [Pseudomonas prosekii]|uniref:hypothetical protein n=1 Tax=Pseudomonas prosekii TaxID=1148509 RepID=UPI0011B2274F|nr:hypothetical protein [Pseudomonas prosekii]